MKNGMLDACHGENTTAALLAGSLYRTSGELDLSSTDIGLNNYLSLAEETKLSGTGEYGSKDLSSPEMMEITRTSTVKFQDGSDDDSINGTESEVSFQFF